MDGKNTAAKAAVNQTMTLTDNTAGNVWDFPVMSGTIGPSVIDVRKLYDTTGYFTFDPGYTSTGSTQSKITYIDGDKGELFYRGIPIEELAEHSDFMEVCYLLLNGELPTAAAKKKFERDITLHTMVHEQLNMFFRGFRRDAHPIAVMWGVFGALPAFNHHSPDSPHPRHHISVGAGAWWPHRGRPQEAAGERRQVAHPRVHQARQKQGRQFPPDGLRPSRLQAL